MASTDRGVPPVLSDGIVSLRRLAPDDADDITLGCSDPLCAEWTTVPSPYRRQDADEWLAQRASADWWSGPAWAVTVLPSPRWCGSIGLRPDGVGGAEVGYLLAPWARGHGHAARALRLVCTWGFAALGLQVITWNAFVGNVASLATARSVGFVVPEHVFPRFVAQRGTRRDAWVGTLVPEQLTTHARNGEARGDYRGPALTRRERDVLRALVGGGTNRDIAVDLGISENTVKNHVRSILEKLQAKSRADAVVVGLRTGLVSLPD
jgi:RimJ/RimL family protein N-acetyltransferase/DNA-binding CsgD family transcriptional regulator